VYPPGWLLLSSMTAWAGGMEVLSEPAGSGSVRKQVIRDDASVVLLFGGEQRGSLDTCGCPRWPRGGLPRIEGYRAVAERRSNVPYVLLNTGYWLDDTIGVDGQMRRDVRVLNQWMMRGVAAGGWDALNVSRHDLPFVAEGVSEAVVSASIDGVSDVQMVRVGDLVIGVTGIAGPSLSALEPEGFDYEPDVHASLDRVMPKLAAADLVVVLAYDIGREARSIAQRSDVDVLLEAGTFESRFEPFVEGDTIWLRSRNQTKRLGELRLWLDDERIVRAVDRRIDLDDRIPSDKELAELRDGQTVDTDRVRVELFGSW
jgi:hypothetical protein